MYVYLYLSTKSKESIPLLIRHLHVSQHTHTHTRRKEEVKYLHCVFCCFVVVAILFLPTVFLLPLLRTCSILNTL